VKKEVMMERYLFIVSGKVQGVFYRKAIQQMVSFGQIRGYIKNRKDATVEVVADLYEDQLGDFLNILRNGSPSSRVNDISWEIIEYNEDELPYDGFEIRY
jgi:acylphosphatase